MLDIVTITKDDFAGCKLTVDSTERLRAAYPVRQIVIDSSCAEVAAVLRDFCSERTNVDYVWTRPEGVSRGYNDGLERATREWIWFLNGGDRLYDKVDIAVVWYLLSQTRASVLSFRIIDHEGHVREIPPLPFLWPPVYVWISLPATFLRTRAVRDAGAFDVSFKVAMDGEFWFRLLNNRTVKLDMVSLPLTDFALDGLSGDKAASGRECLMMIRRHRFMIFKRWVQSGLRYFEAARRYKWRIRKYS